MKFIRKRNKKVFRISRLILISIVGLLLLTYFFFTSYVNPIILSTTKYKIQSLTLKAVNSAISEVMSNNIIYDDLIKTVMNNEGDIVLIQANSNLINRLSKELVRQAQNNIEKMGDIGIKVPIGTFSGIPILVGRGPDIHLKLLPIGSISANFSSSFASAGINQTSHKIYINIEAKVGIIMPLESKSIVNTIQVLVCESVIVGKVPTTYLRANEWDQTIDLIPG